jgi:metallo-beta-lactamase class B
MKKLPCLTKNSLPGWNFTNRFLLVLLLLSGYNLQAQPKPYKSDQLTITRLEPNLYVHESWLHTDTWGKVGCNGMIYVSGDSAIIFDTPASDTASRELIRLIQKKWKLRIKAVIVNHFHNDCLAGLEDFHKAGINSIANERTRELAKATGSPLPKQVFKNELIVELNGKQVINRYFGEGHTRDNIASYVPEYQALFGGCLVKAQNAGFGFVGDANIAAWATTIRSIQQAYPAIKTVVPGHGPAGNAGLLDFTANLFRLPAVEGKAITNTNDSLYQLIYSLDSAFFDAFNRRELEQAMAYFSRDLEFYHDKGGKDDYALTRSKMEQLFARNTETGFRRDLEPGSLEVYPVPGSGAIQINRHRFCHIEQGKMDCGSFKNIMVWKKEGDQWLITRVISVDH